MCQRTLQTMSWVDINKFKPEDYLQGGLLTKMDYWFPRIIFRMKHEAREKNGASLI